MTKLYVGIDISKDKFDVSYTIDGQSTFEYSTHLLNIHSCIIVEFSLRS